MAALAELAVVPVRSSREVRDRVSCGTPWKEAVDAIPRIRQLVVCLADLAFKPFRPWLSLIRTRSSCFTTAGSFAGRSGCGSG